MEETYYSKKLKQHFPTRLDVLLYAHDGRGLGHVSRSIAIGMALRRLYPELRVLLVSGSNMSQALIGKAPLDWIKLPSYASKVTNGVSSGINGPANFYKSVLGHHRGGMLRQIVESFKPRCVIVDHSPLGKREELKEALAASRNFDTKWILGLRAIIGTPPGFWTLPCKQVVQSYYRWLFWYGDQHVLGDQHKNRLADFFQLQPFETGYVSRLYEAGHLIEKTEKSITGTISLPWLSQASRGFVKKLKETLVKRERDGIWKLFVNRDNLSDMKSLFSTLQNVDILAVGEEYTRTLFQSKNAIIYGGYNSLMDVAAAGIPSIVIKREMKDKEQDEHIQLLLEYSPEAIITFEESQIEAVALNQAISLLLKKGSKGQHIETKGSEQAARQVAKILS